MLCSLCVLQLSVRASINQNVKLHTSYLEHCNVVERLLELLTFNPRDCYGLPGKLDYIYNIPEHQLPCSSTAAYAWHKEVSMSVS